MSKEENMKLWNRVCESNPAQLKKVSMRGGYISIDPHSQVQRVTEEFGPVGEGWKYDVQLLQGAPDGLCVMQIWAFRWLGDKWSAPIIQFGCHEWAPKSKNHPNGKLDPDAPKKATTDGLTKCFSYWGYNSDVFLGQWDKRDLDKEKAQAASATRSKSDENKMIALMKEFNELVDTAPEDVQQKARKFVQDNPTLAGIEKAIAKLKASNKTQEAG